MKVKSDRRELLEALTLAQTVVPVKATQPVLQNVKMVATENALEILATDWEVSFRYRIDKVEVMEQGEALLPTRQFADLLRKLPDASVEFKVEDHILMLEKDSDYFKVQGDDPEEFPDLPVFKDEAFVEIDPGVFSEMIKKTAFAAAKEKMRYALNGVYFVLDGNKFIMVATDGKRLAKIEKRIKGKKKLKAEAIVPSKGVNLLEKLLSEEEEPVKLSITETQCMAATRKAVITTRLVEGQFPNYNDVIPKDLSRKLELSTPAFMSVVDQAATFTSPESMSVKLSFSENKLVLSSHAADLGEAKIEHAVEYSGEPMEIGFNPIFIKDVLNVIGSDKFTLSLGERTSPGIISAGEDYLYVVMPVNIL